MEQCSSAGDVADPVAGPHSELGELHANRENIKAYIRSITQPEEKQEQEEESKPGKSKARKSKARPVVREEEKNKFGEVFTPPALINEMLDKLPPEVWTDPNKKWLDPATGFGNFPMVVYERLMEGLADRPDYIDSAVRSKHIITRMLYMVEYNEASCEIIRQRFGTTANLFCGSFVNEDEPISFLDKTIKFDVIVGNPPFNADQTHEGKKGGGANLWPKFVEKSLSGDLLKSGGFLLFVHPALWRKPPSLRAPTLFELMTHENHMLYLEIHNKPDGKRVFGVQTRYDFYVIQKRKPTPDVSTTIILDQRGQTHATFDLSHWHFLPNHSYGVIEPLLRRSDDRPEQIVIFSRGKYGTDKSWVHLDKRTDADIPLIHSTPIGRPRILWSDPGVNCEGVEDCAPMVGVPKVIFGESGINKVIIDLEGRYGMTQCAIGLRIPGVNPDEQKAEAELMAAALESDIFHDILDAMSFSNFRIDWRMFLYLRPYFYKDTMFLSASKHVRPSITKTKTARAEPAYDATEQRKKSKRGPRGGSKKRCKTTRRKRC